MFISEHDVEDMKRRKYSCPNVRKAINLLDSLIQSVNRQSDGWAYWRAPSESARKLSALLLSRLGGNRNNTEAEISDKELKAAVAPIRRMVTYQTKKQKMYGNTFEFDVNAALQI